MRALVLSGGASKGAYQVGALKKWMFEDAVDYDIFCGVSVGSINASYLAQTLIGNPKAAWEKLVAMWDGITTAKVYKSWPVFGKLAALWKPSVFNSRPLIELLESELSDEAIRQSGHKLRIGVVCWSSGEYRVITENQQGIAKWVAASSSYPVFLSPIEIDGKLWTDGGLRNVTPIGEAIRAGATDIDVIMCSNPDRDFSWPTENKSAIPDYALQAVGIMGDEIVRADLQVCGLKNDIAELNDRYRKVRLRVLKPSKSLTADSLSFEPSSIQDMMAVGYKDACDRATESSYGAAYSGRESYRI